MSKKTYRSKKYMAYVKTLPCAVFSSFTACGGDVVAHHTETGGMGIKGADLSCIALCGTHHFDLHHGGKRTFEEVYSLDIRSEVIRTNQGYIEVLESK